MGAGFKGMMRDYPFAVFYYLRLFAQEKESVLDLACGRGGSTRQLVRSGFEDVQGVDADPHKLYEAREHRHFKHIPYLDASLDNLPFRNFAFKAVTCFSPPPELFTEACLTEVKRVLKRGGALFLVSKSDRFSEEIQKTIEKYMGRHFESPASPLDLLQMKFQLSSPKGFEGEDVFSLEEALVYVKSLFFWGQLSQEEQFKCQDHCVIPYLKSRLIDDKILIRYEAFCLVAIKN